jgi:hypothetical protein
MIKIIIKVALAALIVNATWRIGSAYFQFYTFKDAAREVAMTPRATEEQIRAAIMELAPQYDAPLEDEDLVIDQNDRHVVVDASYVRTVEFLPGYAYPWHFAWSVDALVIPGALQPSRPSRR